MENAGKRYSQWIVSPGDYADSMSANTIRRLSEDNLENVEKWSWLSDDELKNELKNSSFYFLEAKIKDSMNLCDIEAITLPTDADPDLVSLAVSRGLKTTS